MIFTTTRSSRNLILLLFFVNGLISSQLSPAQQIIDAAKEGDTRRVGQLINLGADVNEMDGGGYTALHYAARKGYNEIAELLISNGADIHSIKRIGTPLHEACYGGHAYIVKLLLLEKVDVNAVMEYGYTPLLYATERGHKEIIKLLVENGAKTNVQDGDGYTPLQHVVKLGLETVELLISAGADINLKGALGDSPLHEAAIIGDVDITKLLISKEADIHAKNYELNTALHYAAYGGHTGVAKLLIDKGADVNAKGIGLSGSIVYETTPLHTAARYGHYDMAVLLLGSGAKVDGKNAAYKTPGMIAAEEGHESVVILLQKYSSGDPDIESFNYFMQIFRSSGPVPNHLTLKYLDIDISDPAVTYSGINNRKIITVNDDFTIVTYSFNNSMEELFFMTSFTNSGNLVSRLEIGSEGGDQEYYESTSYSILQNNDLLVKKEITREIDDVEHDTIYDYIEILSTGEIHQHTNVDKDTYVRKYEQASSRELTADELRPLSKTELRIMRNEIFANHGYIFKTAGMKEYFSGKKWYVPRYENVDDMLTQIEKDNIQLIRKVETEE